MFRLRGEVLRIGSEIAQAQNYLYRPGIGVTQDARLAIAAGRVTAMHDPTEGGIVTALWELAEASQQTLQVDPDAIPVPPLAGRVCTAFGIDPLCSIASGSLLITAPGADARAISQALQRQGIGCAEIGVAVDGPAQVQRSTAAGFVAWPRPAVDAIAKVFGG